MKEFQRSVGSDTSSLLRLSPDVSSNIETARVFVKSSQVHESNAITKHLVENGAQWPMNKFRLSQVVFNGLLFFESKLVWMIFSTKIENRRRTGDFPAPSVESLNRDLKEFTRARNAENGRDDFDQRDDFVFVFIPDAAFTPEICENRFVEVADGQDSFICLFKSRNIFNSFS